MKYFENFPWTFCLYFLLVFYNNNANLNHDMLYEIEHSISKEYWPDSSFKIHIIYILTPPNLVKIKKFHFLSDSYSPWNLGSRKPLRIEFQALFERKKSFAWTFVKRQTFFKSKFIIFRFVRMPIWSLESFCAFRPMGHWAKPRSGQVLFSAFSSFGAMFIFPELISDIILTLEPVIAG